MSIKDISIFKKCDYGGLRSQLRKRFPSEYERIIHGEIIDKIGEFYLRKQPKNATAFNECTITREAKIYFKKLGFIEEVGIWENNKKLLVVDLYHKETKIALELHWRHGSGKRLLRRLLYYNSMFQKFYCILLQDSRRFKIKNWEKLPSKLKKKGLNVFKFDVAKTVTQRVPLPMEIKKH